MTADIIGSWAGVVWSTINELGPSTVKEIKKATKLREKDIYAAIGWLARENKVAFTSEEGEKDAVITLV